MLQTSKEGILFKVKKSDVFPLMSCAINIGLTLDADTQLDSIGVGGGKAYLIANYGTQISNTDKVC